MYGYFLCANDFYIFFSLSSFLLLFSSIFFSQQNPKITFALASTTDLYLLPITKSQNYPCPALTIDQGGTTKIQKPKN